MNNCIKAVLMSVTIILTGCTQKDVLPFDIPVESLSGARFGFENIASRTTDEIIQGFVIRTAQPEDISFRDKEVCQAAEIILGDALGIPYTCSALGLIGMDFRKPVPSNLLNGFISALRRIGVSVIVTKERVEISQGRSGEYSTSTGDSRVGEIEKSEPVEGGGYTFAEIPQSRQNQILNSVVTVGSIATASLPSGVSREEAEYIISDLGLDLQVVQGRGTVLAMGSIADMGLLKQATLYSETVTLSLPSSPLGIDTLDNIGRGYESVAIAYDEKLRAVVLTGPRDATIDAMKAIKNMIPVLVPIKIEVTFVSFTKSGNRESGVQAGSNIQIGDLILQAGAVSDQNRFEVYLSHAVENGSAAVLSKPSMTVINGEKAEFRSGESIPIVTGVDADGFQQIEYRDTGLIVDVRPIMRAGVVLLEVNVEVSEVDGSSGDNPIINTRRITTSAILSGGDILSLSGLNGSSRSAKSDRNLLLFGGKSRRNAQKNIVFFVTVSY
jgi:hypothetical protein